MRSLGHVRSLLHCCGERAVVTDRRRALGDRSLMCPGVAYASSRSNHRVLRPLTPTSTGYCAGTFTPAEATPRRVWARPVK